MADPYSTVFSAVSDPGRRASALVTSDTVDLAEVPKGIYVGTGGDITMIGVGAPANAPGTVWKNVPSGALIPFRPRRVLATGTTAADMLAVH